MNVIRLLITLAVTLAVGQVCVPLFVDFLRKRWVPDAPEPKGIPARLVGLIEQTFFVLIVAFNVSGAAIAMIAWVTVKMVPNWERYVKQSNKVELAWTSLLGSMASMLIALVGGLVARGAHW